jgi:hypothetical protein
MLPSASVFDFPLCATKLSVALHGLRYPAVGSPLLRVGMFGRSKEAAFAVPNNAAVVGRTTQTYARIHPHRRRRSKISGTHCRYRRRMLSCLPTAPVKHHNRGPASSTKSQRMGADQIAEDEERNGANNQTTGRSQHRQHASPAGHGVAHQPEMVVMPPIFLFSPLPSPSPGSRW